MMSTSFNSIGLFSKLLGTIPRDPTTIVIMFHVSTQWAGIVEYADSIYADPSNECTRYDTKPSNEEAFSPGCWWNVDDLFIFITSGSTLTLSGSTC